MKSILTSIARRILAGSALLLAGGAGYAGSLQFNGSSAYVGAASHPDLNLTTTSNLTLEAWIKPTGRGSDATEGGIIVGREGEYLLARFPDMTIRYAVARTTPTLAWIDSGYPAASNQWTHIALTYDGAFLLLYMNGVEIDRRPATGPMTDADAARNDLEIGRRQLGRSYFQGQIDDVRVWNIARSDLDIVANMTRPLQGNEPGLRAYYRFEEGFGLTTVDATARGPTGTLTGGPIWDPASEALQVPVSTTRPATLVTETTARLNASISTNGILATHSFWLSTNASTALSFEGINDGVSFSLGPNNGYNAYPLTVTAWVRTARSGANGGLVDKYVSPNGWQIYLLNGQVRARYYRDAGSYVTAAADGLNGGNVDDGQWHHAAFTVGPSGGKLYVDGTLKATNRWAGTPGACTSSQLLRLGVYGTATYFAGELDEVTLWNAELSAGAIGQLLTTPPTPAHPQYASLVAHWPMDEGSGRFVNDAHGRNAAGMVIDEPQWLPQGRPDLYLATPLVPIRGTNSVLDLDGFDDHVRVPPGIWFSNDFTIEAWVFERSYNAYSRVIDFGVGQQSQNVFLALSSPATGGPVLSVYRNTIGLSVTAPDPLPLNQWVHLAATVQGNTGTIYVNGVAVVTGRVDPPLSVPRNNNYVGRSNWPDPYANALYDDLRIWKVARTLAQIRQSMTEPVAPEDPNLVLNYRFDEASGLSVIDSRSLSPQHGTLTNGASRLSFERASVDLSGLTPGTKYYFHSVATSPHGTQIGKSQGFATLTPAAGTALDFHGGGDYVRTPNLRSYFTNETVTLEVWFNARGPGVIVDERQAVGDLAGYADSQIEIVGTTNALQGEVRIRVWNSAAFSLGKVPYGTWNHAVLRYNKATLTLDGFLNGSKPGNGLSPVDRIAPWEANASYGLVYVLGLADGTHLGSGAWFNGELDEFRIWSMARDATNILRDFNRRLQGNEPGLVAYYRMDQGAGGGLLDATGQGRDGRLVSSPAWVPSTAPVGWPIVAESEVANVVLGDVTIDAAVKGETYTETRVWIEYGQYAPVPGSAENHIYGYPTNAVPDMLTEFNFNVPPAHVGTFNNIAFWVDDPTRPPDWPGAPLNYFAMRYLGRIFLPATGIYTFYAQSDDGSQLYVDGQLTVTNDGVHGRFERGAVTHLGAGHHWLEARMFDYTGAAGLIVSYAGPGVLKQVIPPEVFLRHEPVFAASTAPQTIPAGSGFQDFTGMATNLGESGTYAFRVVAANAAGTNYGPVQTALMGSAGAFTALYFNGVRACVEVPGGTNFLAFPGTEAFTIEAWINPVSLGATQTVVSKFNQPAQREYFLALDGQGRVVFHRQGSDFVSSTPVVTGQYTHVAATFDGLRRRIYINGQLDLAVDPGSGAGTNRNAPFLIGARYWSNSLADFFQGVIDDVRVWQVARSEIQIQSDRNRRLSGYELGLVAYYRFDEAQGSLASDSTVSENLGLHLNGPVYVPSGVLFACTGAPPELSIEILDFAPGVIVWWPITCNEYALEEADNPEALPDGWYPVLEPVTPIGDTYLMVVLWDRYENGFFRLRRL